MYIFLFRFFYDKESESGERLRPIYDFFLANPCRLPRKSQAEGHGNHQRVLRAIGLEATTIAEIVEQVGLEIEAEWAE